jgi:hypothetical protein
MLRGFCWTHARLRDPSCFGEALKSSSWINAHDRGSVLTAPFIASFDLGLQATWTAVLLLLRHVLTPFIKHCMAS